MFLVSLPLIISLYISFLRLFQLPRLFFPLVVNDDDNDDDDSCSLSLNLLALSSTLFTVHIYLCYIIRRVCFKQIPREHSTRSLHMSFSWCPFVHRRCRTPREIRENRTRGKDTFCDPYFVSDIPVLFADERKKTFVPFNRTLARVRLLRPRTLLSNHLFSGPRWRPSS